MPNSWNEKCITKCWWFASSSSNKEYETLQYDNGSTSCNCPGWTRRVANDGSRSCKHTRYVDSNQADDKCIRSHDYQTKPEVKTKTPPEKKKVKPNGVQTTLKLTSARKVQW